VSDYLWDRSGPADLEVARLERALGKLRQPHPPAPLRLPVSAAVHTARPRWFFASVAAAAAMVIAVGGLTWRMQIEAQPGLEVTRVAGTPRIGSRAVSDTRELRIGHWLQTDSQARATIDVGNIGRVDVEPDTRLGLLSTRPGDYRLHLARGTMHALIWAPPGQFAVHTPSSTAVDLGCSYTLSVDDGGVGIVRVTSGWVGFEWKGREAVIPNGAVCITRPGLGPGTPHYEVTSDAFRAALTMIDMRGGTSQQRAAALETVLNEAQVRDVMTLWHLLTRVDADQRGRVFDRLAELSPAPPGVTRDGVLAGREEMLDAWWDSFGFGTAGWWRTWKQQWRDK
jgi:hypothetical protein